MATIESLPLKSLVFIHRTFLYSFGQTQNPPIHDNTRVFTRCGYVKQRDDVIMTTSTL